MGLAFVSGQILGGVLLQANILGLGWRAIFLVNVPVGAVALIAAAHRGPAGARTAPAAARPGSARSASRRAWRWRWCR